MIKLYGGARSRATIVRWYLEELGVPYEFVLLDMQSSEHLKPEFLAINPIGKVPAIEDGDLKLWESGAILLYLARKYGQMPESLAEQAIVDQWVLFANATLGPGIFVEATREREQDRLLAPLDAIFASQPYMLGEHFGVVDVAVGSILAYIPMMLQLDLSDYPAVVKYIEGIQNRPAYQKAMQGR